MDNKMQEILIDLVFNDCCSVVKQRDGGIPTKDIKKWFVKQLSNSTNKE